MQYPYARSPEQDGPSPPQRRQHALQPPSLLTTTLGNAHNLGLGIAGHTPVSATSLSSPFSTYQTSPYPGSPTGAMRGASPMVHRPPSAFNTAYNPQQWGPVRSGSSPAPNSSSRPASIIRQPNQSTRVAVLAPRPVGPDGKANDPRRKEIPLTFINIEPVASPPPPYSPRRGHDHGDSPGQLTGALSPPDTLSPDTDTSHHGTPVSAATTISPDFVSRPCIGRSPVPPSQPYSNDSPSTTFAPAYPPPRPASGLSNRVRSSSKNHADRILSSFTSRGKTTNTTSVNAIDALRETTVQAIARAPETVSAEFSAKPPTSRRAASTGGIGLNGQSSRGGSRSSSQNRWKPGMPLPPPPPGPPPSTTRSQSMSRASESPSTELAPPSALRTRRPPGHGTSLDPVPPTPADWREEDSTAHQTTWSNRPNGPGPLHIDTGSIIRKGCSAADDPCTAISSTQQAAHLQREFSNSTLFRSPAVRNRSAKGIRERRSESRNGKGRGPEERVETPPSSTALWTSDSDNVKPTDLVLPTGGNCNSQSTANKSTPRSGRSLRSLDETLHTMDSRLAPADANSFESAHSTPRQESARGFQFPKSITPTPPFSPGQDSFTKPLSRALVSPAIPPKSLPTPPPQNSIEPDFASHDSASASTNRPVSHLLHIPNKNDSIQAPLMPSRKPHRGSTTDLLGSEGPAAFAQRAIERHRNFAEREATAANDSERLYLFTRFMLAESRIRRDQYAAVFEEEDIDITELTEGLFIQTNASENPKDGRRNSQVDSVPARDRNTSRSSTQDINSHGGSSAIGQVQESPISMGTDSSPQNRPESSWWNDYVPCLSPIASMSAVTGQDETDAATGQDEMDSRGRAPSRWWEDKSGESAQGDAFRVLERSKRESKYMGLPPEARNSPGLFENEASGFSSGLRNQMGGPSQQGAYAQNELPPEKVGWPKETMSLPPPPLHPPTPRSAPYTPDPKKLDISRLITLPPPYPRHHPAVNNNHPDLADIRAVVRSLLDLREVDTIRESFRSQVYERRQRTETWRKHQRSLHNQEVQFQLEQGEISEEDFDEAEMEFEAKLHKSEKDFLQADFDLFQKVVVSPLHSIFSERITQATSSFDELSSRLFSDAQQQSPNMPQEEGDEQPELLEKLTQLKWLFEARETLHRQTYELLSERNNKYRAIVLLPYQQSRNHEKLAEAESFFAQDAHERKFAFEKAISSRSEGFVTVIEVNVIRGVEVQLSAFWDIAPALLKVLQKIPLHLRGFEIQIPQDEFAENPIYYDHPMQYLYSLLGHAEKSSHQFIESQINLLCLLHESKEGALVARYRVGETGATAGQPWDGERLKEMEEKKLTDDLKEKVGVVEGQWEEALGEELMGVRERVREWLLEEGGWNEDEDEV